MYFGVYYLKKYPAFDKIRTAERILKAKARTNRHTIATFWF